MNRIRRIMYRPASCPGSRQSLSPATAECQRIRPRYSALISSPFQIRTPPATTLWSAPLPSACELRYAWQTCFIRPRSDRAGLDRNQILANNPVIEFRDVNYVLPNHQPLLSGLNLQVQRGETLVLLGRSGSGKTTTLKLINRLLTPSSGEVRVNGIPTSDTDVIKLRRSIGYVIQEV